MLVLKSKIQEKMTNPPITKKFDAEVSKVLQLMIHSLYTNKDIFLRELISNASDACDKLRYAALTKSELLGDDAELKVIISVDKDAKTLSISDNGIGMSEQELSENLGTVARSGTQEFLSAMTQNKDANLIGQFGVGFYSSFVVADKVTVESCRAGETTCHTWESDGLEQYTITEGGSVNRGTKITLHLKEADYLDHHKITYIVETYSNHISFPIVFIETNGDETLLNTATALWMRPKKDITEEEYSQFYKDVGHAYDEPYMTFHNRVEGKIEYINLLFIPTKPPFDLFHPDRMRRVKLYVKRVFITDENVDIIPQYLRFLRGVIDSEDLPLNISRETLQHNAMLNTINKSITKRVLKELRKKAENDPAEFAEFWRNFGAVLKEGLCEEIVDRESILEVCHFKTTTSDNKFIRLDELNSEQEFIYYITGDNLETLKNSPQLEGFIKKGIEVLLLTDHVDDFWVTVVGEYKGRKFKSITRAGIDLDNEKTTENTGNVEKLISYMKDLFKDEVKDIRVSHKLETSSVCLAVDEGAMDFRMERFLHENNQIKSRMAKILEINPEHAVVKNLYGLLDKDDAKLADTCWLLLDQARIIEGEEVGNPKEFAERLNRVMEKGL